MLRNVHVAVIYDLIWILGRIAIGASELLSPIVFAQLVLVLRRLVRVKYAAIFADASPYLGKPP